MRRIIQCSRAIAEAVKICRPGVIPVYPITPQTIVPETLSEFINNGQLKSEMIYVESEHSALSACIGASATGVRTFTATASQGLALMHEVLFITSGMRLPVVMVVTNRALSAPINIWNDHQDSISERDSGWIQFYCADSQEAHDTIFHAYKVAEKMFLPAMVCVDGFTLSHVFEPVDLLNESDIGKFLDDFKPAFKLDPAKPVTMGPVVYPGDYMKFKVQQQDAMLRSIPLIRDVNRQFKYFFGRSYGDGLVEEYKVNDADLVFVCMGSMFGTVKFVVDELRKKGKRVGVLRVRCFRPFPKDSLRSALKDAKALVVFDRNISLGNDGALVSEVKALFPDKKVKGYIIGLGGADITPKHIFRAIIEFKKEVGWLL
ncbi:MAG: transketolase C-terminal domain-containing protein [archaeon]